jgi:hypothetical protein
MLTNETLLSAGLLLGVSRFITLWYYLLAVQERGLTTVGILILSASRFVGPSAPTGFL